ncbi:hypothetical protein [Massilia cavernae]|uniref:Methyl-accepting transducer domain-containing protein n=1 Tax=Massilia cavernae TaxID=2320864 RepID=A0A418XQQ7_9BURK|nr:hypothetical protein D3872_16125 [Massilia cavernae]
MSEITAASQERSDGIGQINQAITQMDQMTQQNAALVEQAATASESMQDHARTVAQAIGVEFRHPAVDPTRTQCRQRVPRFLLGVRTNW